jgi:hypothetical protein
MQVAFLCCCSLLRGLPPLLLCGALVVVLFPLNLNHPQMMTYKNLMKEPQQLALGFCNVLLRECVQTQVRLCVADHRKRKY